MAKTIHKREMGFEDRTALK